MTQIILKNKNSVGSVPATTDLVSGEVALNMADTRLFCLSSDGSSVVQLAGTGYDHHKLGSLGTGDDHTQYIFDAPADSDRNTVVPKADAVSLTLQRFSSTQDSSIQSWSTETGLPLSWVDADGTFNGLGSGLTNLDASSLATGMVHTLVLGSGTADSTTFLRGDSTWATIPNIPSTNAAYWVKVGDVSIPNGVDMSLIGPGILLNTSTGAPALAVAGTDYLAPTGDGAGLTNLRWAQVVDFATGVKTVPLSDLAIPIGSVNMATFGIINLAPPTQADDAATKAYVDALAAGQTVLSPVDAASTADLALTGGSSLKVDGVTLADGSRLLLKDQTDPVENGIYEVSGIGTAYVLTRSWDMASDSTAVSGSYIHVIGGTINGGSSYTLTTPNPITVDTTPEIWTLYSSTSNPISGYGIIVTGNQIAIDTTWPGQTAITTLGIITTGTWQATLIGAIYGGTGLSAVAAGDLLFGSGINTWSNFTKGTANQILMMDTNGDFPVWGNVIDGGTW